MNTEITHLLSSTHEAALGTLKDGQPFVSSVGFIYEPSSQLEKIGSLYMLLSDLAQHTKNLKANRVASLLIVESNSELPIHEKKRVTLLGEGILIEDPKQFERLKPLYLKNFPKAELFFQLPDFRFYRFDTREAHWIGGFGKAAVILNNPITKRQ